MTLGIEASRANRPAKTGTERYAHDLLCAIARVDTTTPIRLYTDVPLSPSLNGLGPNFEERVLRWPPRRLWTQCRLSWEMLLHAPDVLYVPSHIMPLFHPRRTVTMLHDVGFFRFPELYSRLALRYHRWDAFFAARSAWKVLVPTAFTKQETLRFTDCPEEKLRVVHHGFDPTPFRTADREQGAAVLRRLGVTKPFVLFVGRLETKKNVPLLLEAFRRFSATPPGSEAQLLLIGKRGHGFEPADVGPNVVVPGFVGDSEYRTLLPHATCFAFPSKYEGFGFPVLEAQAAGVPILVSDIPVLKEVGGSGVLACEQDPDHIADGLRRLFTDSHLRATLKEEGERNLARFSWETCARATLAELVPK